MVRYPKRTLYGLRQVPRSEEELGYSESVPVLGGRDALSRLMDGKRVYIIVWVANSLVMVDCEGYGALGEEVRCA